MKGVIGWAGRKKFMLLYDPKRYSAIASVNSQPQKALTHPAQRLYTQEALSLPPPLAFRLGICWPPSVSSSAPPAGAPEVLARRR